jgi:hypothetical protein
VKYFKIFLELVLLFLLIFFLLVFYLIRFKSTTYYGKKLRVEILHHNYLTSLLNLNQPGDARFLYLKSSRDNLRVEVNYLPRQKPDNEVDGWIKKMILGTTGKNVDIEISEDLFDDAKISYSDDDLNNIRNKLSSRFAPLKLNIVYLTKYKETPSLVGLTLHRDTLFIFKENLNSLSEDEIIQKKLEESTLMHEWGHLLGLEHEDDINCIMAEQVDVYTNKAWLNTIPTEYCPTEYYHLKDISD